MHDLNSERHWNLLDVAHIFANETQMQRHKETRERKAETRHSTAKIHDTFDLWVTWLHSRHNKTSNVYISRVFIVPSRVCGWGGKGREPETNYSTICENGLCLILLPNIFVQFYRDWPERLPAETETRLIAHWPRMISLNATLNIFCPKNRNT